MLQTFGKPFGNACYAGYWATKDLASNNSKFAILPLKIISSTSAGRNVDFSLVLLSIETAIL